jgi:predicted enzyme related to lactoylglutathione lyase
METKRVEAGAVKLRGMCTISLWADDLPAARRWYTEVLGIEPYFTSEAVGLGPGYVEFRIGDHQDELGIVDRRFAPPGFAAGLGGTITFWHVDDLPATLDRLRSLGAIPLQPMTQRGPGFVTASVIDPFGNVLGIMYNRHFLEALGDDRAARTRPGLPPGLDGTGGAQEGQ